MKDGGAVEMSLIGAKVYWVPRRKWLASNFRVSEPCSCVGLWKSAIQADVAL